MFQYKIVSAIFTRGTWRLQVFYNPYRHGTWYPVWIEQKMEYSTDCSQCTYKNSSFDVEMCTSRGLWYAKSAQFITNVQSRRYGQSLDLTVFWDFECFHGITIARICISTHFRCSRILLRDFFYFFRQQNEKSSWKLPAVMVWRSLCRIDPAWITKYCNQPKRFRRLRPERFWSYDLLK